MHFYTSAIGFHYRKRKIPTKMTLFWNTFGHFRHQGDNFLAYTLDIDLTHGVNLACRNICNIPPFTEKLSQAVGMQAKCYISTADCSQTPSAGSRPAVRH